MKKELFAAVLLAVMLTAALLNIRKISCLTNNTANFIESAKIHAESENWEHAAEDVKKAISLWESAHFYTHTVVCHSDADMIIDDMHNLLAEVYAKDTGRTMGTAQMLIAHLEHVAEAESLHWNSIF